MTVNPKEGDVGRRVIYQPLGRPRHEAEVGEVTSWNDVYVFARFAPGCASKGCRRANLEWENEAPDGRNYLDKFAGAYVIKGYPE